MTEPREIESKLTGTTLLIYWYLLSKDSEVTIRELQHKLHFSSPSIASHHLNKLQSLGIVEKGTDGVYKLTKYIPVGVLKHFVRIRGILLPRYFFLACFFTSALLFSLFWSFIINPGILDRLIMITVCSLATIISWWETYRLYKLKVL